MNVAIIGVSCKFPGANNYSEFWENLIGKKSSISEIPSSRWDWQEYWGDPKQQAQKSNSKWGGFVADVNAFDANFFGILPKVVETMDPQQRLMMELVWSCLEDAGIAPSSLRGKKVGVMLGVFNHDYKETQDSTNIAIEAHYSTGTAASIIANRVSHYFDLKGPSFPIDTACSSSLNAIHSAIQALKFGDCEMALAGGVNLLLTPTRHISFSKMGMLSPTGQCMTFDASANGYVRGEGAGVVLLKPLEKAIADGDAIYGVVKGTAVNHCGETYTLTYPSSVAQANVIQEAHERADVPVNTVNYVEAHGTGTPKGDPIEFDGLMRAFEALAARQGVSLKPGYCALGSVKTNIGHLEAAAGIAGVIKVLLSFRNKQLPALQNFSGLNPKISIENTPFSILSEHKQWLPELASGDDQSIRSPLRAGVSSFGFGGTNSHIVLEEFVRGDNPKAINKPAYLLVLSAKSPAALQRLKSNLLLWLDKNQNTGLPDLSAGLLVGRDHHAVRFACVVKDLKGAMTALRDSANGTAQYSIVNRDDLELLAEVTQSAKKIIEKSAKSDSKKSYLESLSRLAELYVKGADPIWRELFSSGQILRLNLPTYPFEKDTFWIAKDEKGNTHNNSHPLLHTVLSGGNKKSFYSLFDGQEFFLKDHQVKNQRVLPAVAYLEVMYQSMMRAAHAQLNGADSTVELRDVIWLRPFTMSDGVKELRATLHVENIEKVGSPLKFEFISGVEDLSLVKNCQAKVFMVERNEPVPLPNFNYPGSDWSTYSSSDCYERFSTLGFGYGKSHQSIEILAQNADQVLVKLVMPTELQDSVGEYTLHPSIADGALQAAVALVSGLATDANGAAQSLSPYLPFSLDSLRVYRPTQLAQWAWVRPVGGNNPSQAKKIDIDIFSEIPDADGRSQLIAQFKGLGLRQFEKDALPSNELANHPFKDKIMNIQDHFYIPNWFKQPSNSTLEILDSLLIIGDPKDVSLCVSRLKRNSTFSSTTIISAEFSSSYAKKSSNEYALRAGSDVDFLALVNDISAEQSVPRNVLILSKELSKEAGIEIGVDLSRGAESSFCLVKAYLKVAKSARFINLVQGSGVDFIPVYQALGAFYKTVKVERPAYSGRVVICDIENSSDASLAGLIASEFTDNSVYTDIRYLDGARFVRDFVATDEIKTFFNLTSEQAAFKTGGVYLITGGLGALGLLVAGYLLKHYDARIYLTGRSSLTAEKKKLLEAIDTRGNRIVYMPCDITNANSVSAMVSSINDQGFKLNGVIHSAGVIEDSFILKKEFASFSRVIAPKVMGTINLDEATKGQPLDVFVLFSSVTGVLGNLGQCDYAFANSYEDYFSHYRNDLVHLGERNGKAMSINWPYWKEGGMVLTDKEEAILRKNFGIVPLENANGLQALEYAVAAPVSQLAVLEGDKEKVRQVLGVRANVNEAAFTEAEREIALRKSGSNSSKATDVSILKEHAVKYLISQFAKEVSLSEDKFELYAPFQQYGFDSVVMVDLVILLEEEFENLPATLFFEYKNINDLADFFVANYPEKFVASKGGAGADEVALERPTESKSDINQVKNVVVSYLIELFAKEVELPAERFELYAPFQQYGFDSVVMVNLVIALEEKFENLPATLFFEYKNINDLADFFASHYAAHFESMVPPAAPSVTASSNQNAADNSAPVELPIAAMPTAEQTRSSMHGNAQAPAKEDIVIIGVSGRYPEAETLAEFWNNLKDGVDCIREIPEDRNWGVENLFQPGPAVLGKSYSKWGGFLKSIDHFDPLFFGISPAEAEVMDPHERLFLETVALAMEDAGYCPDKLAQPVGVHESPVGVYVGTMWGDYQLFGVEGDKPKNMIAPRSWYWAVANRISYQFNFSGPSITLDTACSSSLTAIHLACEALKQGDISVGIAGGVNLSLHPQKYNTLSDLHFLSSDGRCRSFGVGGDGYVPAEAVGAIILKRKSDALRDGDHIYAVIKSSSINHGGKTSGFTVPNPNRQGALIKDAIARSGINPRHISYVEAHGTGTSLGDPIEISGLTKAYEQADTQYCAVGSVKSNIGHAEAAAGVAGVTKILLQLKHKALAPSLHSNTLNPYAKIDQSPFYVLQKLEEWQRPTQTDPATGKMIELPRVAGLSSFGAGGANAHFIFEEYPAESDPRNYSPRTSDPVLVVLSAKREESLEKMVVQLRDFIVSEPQTHLADIAYTLQIGRVHMDYGIAVIAASLAELQTKLNDYLAAKGRSDTSYGIYSGKRPRNRNAKNDFSDQQVDEWLLRKDLNSLADAWLKGQENIAWEKLYNSGSAFRISVPGYVYSRQRYWVTVPNNATQFDALSSLIDKNVSTFEEQLFVKTFNQNAFYLKDHKLGKKCVLPGVAYLELARQAVQLAANGEPVLGLTDIKWLKPIVVNGAQESIQISLRPSAGNVEFEIFKSASGGGRILFCSGSAVVSRYSSASSVQGMRLPLPVVDPHTIKARSTHLNEHQINSGFESFGFGFGPSFQVMKGLFVNHSEAMADLALSTELVNSTDDYVLHPALLDGALRTAVGIGGFGAANAGMPLPISLGRIVIHKPLTENCISYAVYSTSQPTQAGQRSYDIYILNTRGEMLVTLLGFTTQYVSHFADTKKSTDQLISVGEPQRPQVTATKAPASYVAPAALYSVPSPATKTVYSPVNVAKKYLAELVSQVTKIPPGQIDTATALENYGIDSVMIMAMNEKLEAIFGLSVPKTLFFEYQDIDSLAEYFSENHAEDIHKIQFDETAVPVESPVPVAPSQIALDGIARDYLSVLLARFTKLDQAQIDCDAAIEDYGIDSVMIMGMNEDLEKSFGQEIPKTLFFEYQTINELVDFLVENHATELRALSPAVETKASDTVPTRAASGAITMSDTLAEVSAGNIKSRFGNSSTEITFASGEAAHHEHRLAEPRVDYLSSATQSANQFSQSNAVPLSAADQLKLTISALSDVEVENLLRELLAADELETEF